MTTTLIICAGDATRWGNYLGVPKHFVPVDDEEPLLYRTVRQARERGLAPIVVSRADDEYKIPGATQYIAKLDPRNFDADKFLSSWELWDSDERTLVLYGDVFFTDAAMDTIAEHDRREWMLFCRPFPSWFTGKPYGECFAHSFWPEHWAEHLAAFGRIIDLRRAGILTRCGGWEHHKAMCGFGDAVIADMYTLAASRRVVIDDHTDDFDCSYDYDTWKALRYRPVPEYMRHE